MYSESDIDGAVEAGVLTPDAAAALRNHIAATREAPAVDEEHFRLLTGFNDIFVSIALALLLVALAQIGATIAEPAAGLAVAVASWFLAEYFTRKRRMALPSILLLLAFVGGVAATLIGTMVRIDPDFDDRTNAFIAAGIAGITALSAWVHWRRFMVPITVAAGTVALAGTALAVTLGAVPAAKDYVFPIILGAGVLVFLLAMWWDTSDHERRTRRSDVAFWLHLAAAPMIAHPVFQMLGVFDNDVGLPTAGIVLGLYVAFALVALAVDRRALLVSSLAYVLYAMYAVVQATGAVELSSAITALVIGSALLTLSAFWQHTRSLVIRPLGGLGQYLPPVTTTVPA